MRNRDITAAKEFGILERCSEFEEDLLKINDLVPESGGGVDFDLNGFRNDIRYVIIVPKYHISADRQDYWEARRSLIKSVISTAERYDLHKTEDRIEDYGEHFYFVFRCGETWRVLSRKETI